MDIEREMRTMRRMIDDLYCENNTLKSQVGAQHLKICSILRNSRLDQRAIVQLYLRQERLETWAERVIFKYLI